MKRWQDIQTAYMSTKINCCERWTNYPCALANRETSEVSRSSRKYWDSEWCIERESESCVQYGIILRIA
ncbi:hypothetical protein CEXT_778061 [Caerostris extrusa]|uniref:Uncharacterized protein n=1 Tax=Caerostris extrusa TaxID=172846 RepID=A0AAV4R6K4_CAEEX|nr:hypothetical protein CEXT_778061 [Caerostris extrusa]